MSPRRHPSSLPTYSHSHVNHPYYEYHNRQRSGRRTSRPPSRACSISQASHEDTFSGNSSTCEPSPISPSTPRSIISSPGISHRYRDETPNAAMVPLTIAADRIRLDATEVGQQHSDYPHHQHHPRRYSDSDPENTPGTPSVKHSEYSDSAPPPPPPTRQPLRPW